MTSRILVTGAAGFLGATFARYAYSKGAVLGLLVRPASPSLRLAGVIEHSSLLHGDMRDEAGIRSAIDAFRPDCIVHCASTLWVKPGQTDLGLHFDVNAKGTLRLIEVAKEKGIRLIYTGSSSVYGEGAALNESTSQPHPNSVYAVSKLAVSELIRFYGAQGADCAELRIFAPYGPLDSSNRLIQFVIAKALRGEALELTSGRQKRDWVYADDVAEALWLAGTKPVPHGAIMNIGGGNSISVGETVRTILTILGRDVTLAKFGARPDRPDEMYDNEADIGQARRILGWSPRTKLDEGIAMVAGFMKDNAELAAKLT